MFAAYCILSGLGAIAAGVSFTGVGNWWALVLTGLVQGALGIIILSNPAAGPLALAYLFALWWITTGMLEISSAVLLRPYIENEFWWLLLGVITVAFGFYVLLYPNLGVLALVYTIGFYAVLAGTSLVAFAFRIKGLGDGSNRRATA